MTRLARSAGQRTYAMAFVLLGAVTVFSGAVSTTDVASAFTSGGCDTERHGDLLGGTLMPGSAVGEVQFEVRCTEFGEFTLTATVSGSAELAAAVEVEVSRDEDVLYHGPLSQLAVVERLGPGHNRIIVRGALADDYDAGGRITLDLRMQVAGM